MHTGHADKEARVVSAQSTFSFSHRTPIPLPRLLGGPWSQGPIPSPPCSCFRVLSRKGYSTPSPHSSPISVRFCLLKLLRSPWGRRRQKRKTTSIYDIDSRVRTPNLRQVGRWCRQQLNHWGAGVKNGHVLEF